ncbi:MAG: hypothetical protein NTZ83_02205 [Candidatus Pacearchaeota archaeon]|nr:hypothetical protein [Candidatus Pacearchaeota archaeon]
MAHKFMKDISLIISYEEKNTSLEDVKRKVDFVKNLDLGAANREETLKVHICDDGNVKIFPKNDKTTYFGFHKLKGCCINYFGNYVDVFDEEGGKLDHYWFYSEPQK